MYHRDVPAKRDYVRVAADLASMSIPFEMVPLPFDAKRFVVKDEYRVNLDGMVDEQPPHGAMVVSRKQVTTFMRKAMEAYGELEPEMGPEDAKGNAFIEVWDWYDDEAYPPIAVYDPKTGYNLIVFQDDMTPSEALTINVGEGAGAWYYTLVCESVPGELGIIHEDQGKFESEMAAVAAALAEVERYADGHDWNRIEFARRLIESGLGLSDAWELQPGNPPYRWHRKESGDADG